MYKRCIFDKTGLEPRNFFNLVQFLMYDLACRNKITVEDTLELIYVRNPDPDLLQQHIFEIFGEREKTEDGQEREILFDEYLKQMRKNDLERRKKLEKERKTVTKVIGKKEEEDWLNVPSYLYHLIVPFLYNGEMIEINTLKGEGFQGEFYKLHFQKQGFLMFPRPDLNNLVHFSRSQQRELGRIGVRFNLTSLLKYPHFFRDINFILVTDSQETILLPFLARLLPEATIIATSLSYQLARISL